MPCRVVCGLLAIALVAPGAGAQVAEAGVRRPTFVRVESADGRPLAGATVVFAGGLPHLGDAGERDLQQVATDARGRAQAKLRPGLCYVAWATSPAAAHGATATTPVHGWFGAGALLTLRCAAPAAPRRVRLQGESAWAKHGPLRFVLLTSWPGTVVELVPEADGGLLVPPGPVHRLEVQTAAGRPLWHAAVGADEVLAIPPPRGLRVRVVDERGAPLAGAAMRHRVGRVPPWRLDGFGGVSEDRWRELGATGDDGTCTVEVPYAAEPLVDQKHGELLLFACVPGRQQVAGGVFNNVLYQDDRKAAAVANGELRFTCRPAEPLRGVVPAMPAGSFVHLAAVCKIYHERTSYSHDPRSFVAPVAADGTFVFDGLPAELHGSRLSLVPPLDARRPVPWFPAVGGRELPAMVAGDGRPASAEAFADLSLRVLEPGGGPALGLCAVVAPAAQQGVLLRDSAIRFPLDARGEAALRLPPGKWLVLAAGAAGWTAQLHDLAAGVSTATAAMQPLAVMRVELRNDLGQAIAGAGVVSRGTTTRGNSDPLRTMLQTLRWQSTPVWQSLRTDGDGRVAIPFVPVDGMTQQLELRWDGGGSEQFELQPTDDWLLVRAR